MLLPAYKHAFRIVQDNTAEIRVRRRLLASIAFCFVMCLAGMVWTWRIGVQANAIKHLLGHVYDAIDEIQAQQSRPGEGTAL